VSVEQETGLVRLGGLERLGVLVVVLTVSDALHVHNLVSCGHHGQPVPLVTPVPLAQAHVYHGY